MRPIAWVLMHPTRAAVAELLVKLRRTSPGVNRRVMEAVVSTIHDNSSRTLCGGIFAHRLVGMWSRITDSPSWLHSESLDDFEGLACRCDSLNRELSQQIAAHESVVVMGDPIFIENLVQHGYRIQFFFSDVTHMTNAELIECYPQRFDGVVGAWLAHTKTPDHYGEVQFSEAIA